MQQELVWNDFVIQDRAAREAQVAQLKGESEARFRLVPVDDGLILAGKRVVPGDVLRTEILNNFLKLLAL